MRASGLQCVDHVKVVRPCLSEIFPWMRTGVAGDKTLRPILRRTIRIVLLKCGGIVLLLIAEDRAKAVEMRGIRNQTIPVIMRNLVAKMSKQGAVGLAHLAAPAFALDIVGFGKIDGDETMFMAGHDGDVSSRCRLIGNEIESEPCGVFGLGREREAELQQCVEQPVFRKLDLLPVRGIVLQRQVRDRAVVAACGAKNFRLVRRYSCRRRAGSWRNSDIGLLARPMRARPQCQLRRRAPVLSKSDLTTDSRGSFRSFRTECFQNRATRGSAGIERAS